MYQGKVLDDNDPLERDRILVSIDGLHNEDEGIWMQDVLSRSYQGDVPEIGTMVWCDIDNSDPSLGYYYGYVKY